jgi:hypothetical protein
MRAGTVQYRTVPSAQVHRHPDVSAWPLSEQLHARLEVHRERNFGQGRGIALQCRCPLDNSRHGVGASPCAVLRRIEHGTRPSVARSGCCSGLRGCGPTGRALALRCRPAPCHKVVRCFPSASSAAWQCTPPVCMVCGRCTCCSTSSACWKTSGRRERSQAGCGGRHALGSELRIGWYRRCA